MEFEYKQTDFLKRGAMKTKKAVCEDNSELLYNNISDYSVLFTQLKELRQEPTPNIPVLIQTLNGIAEYFSRDGGISHSVLESNNTFYILFELLYSIPRGLNLPFNLVLDVISQVIQHTPETVDQFVISNNNEDFTIIDQARLILLSFTVEINPESSEPPPDFFCPNFDIDTLNISTNIIWSLCVSDQKISAFYKLGLLEIFSMILKRNFNDDFEIPRKCKIIDCLTSILLKTADSLFLHKDDIDTVFRSFFSIFESFQENQKFFDVFHVLYANLNKLLSKDERIVVIFDVHGFYLQTMNVLEYIFSENINDPNQIMSIFDFISKTLYIDIELDDDEEENECELVSSYKKVVNLIGTPPTVKNIYQYILCRTISQGSKLAQNEKYKFPRKDVKILVTLFDILESLIMGKNEPIIEYTDIEKVYYFIDEFGELSLKNSCNNFIVGMIQNLPIDVLRSFLGSDFIADLFLSYESSNSINADFVISAIQYILIELNITNDDILAAERNDNEAVLIKSHFYDILTSFLCYDDENQVKAQYLINTYYKGFKKIA